LASLAERQDGHDRALSLYYRGAMLNRAGHFAEALISLDQALVAAADLVLAREERGESLWQLGRKDDAIAAWAGAVKANPGLVVASQMLAGAALAKGQTEVSAAWEKQPTKNTPQDPYFQWMVGSAPAKHRGMKRAGRKAFPASDPTRPLVSARDGSLRNSDLSDLISNISQNVLL